jgi:hypothetical protein
LQKRFVLPLEAWHTLRSHDLEMILALHSDGVSDSRHSADVMKKEGEGFR